MTTGIRARLFSRLGDLKMAVGNEIRERLSRLEASFGQTPQTWENNSVVDRIVALEAVQRSLLDDVAAIRKDHEDRCLEMAVMKRAMAANTVGAVERPKIKVPKPKGFGGARSAKELENFLWDMEQYFVAFTVPEEERVTVVCMYLEGDAKLWWRTRTIDDENAGRPKIESWDRLKKELREQFLPSNSSWDARNRLMQLKHVGSVRDYVKDFCSLLLDIRGMSEEDKLYNFLSSLKQWVQVELRRHRVNDLPSAIVVADALVDLSGSEKSDASSLHFKGKDAKNKGKGEWLEEMQAGSQWLEEMQAGSQTSGSSTLKSTQGCFICDGSHRARECPRRGLINALLVEENPAAVEEANKQGVELLGSLQINSQIVDSDFNHLSLLTTLVSDWNAAKAKLMHVTVKINGIMVMAMVDTGSTSTFISERLVQLCGLKMCSFRSYVKAASRKLKVVAGAVHGANLRISDFDFKAELLVMPLDDFEMILGIDFCRESKVVPIPHLDGLMVIKGEKQTFIPCSYPFGKRRVREEPECSSNASGKRLKIERESPPPLPFEPEHDEVTDISSNFGEFVDMLIPGLPLIGDTQNAFGQKGGNSGGYSENFGQNSPPTEEWIMVDLQRLVDQHAVSGIHARNEAECAGADSDDGSMRTSNSRGRGGLLDP